MSCGLFFATFEWVKQQGYYYFLDEIYGLHVDSPATIMELEMGWDHKISQSKTTIEQRPPLILEPLFIIFAGATAAVVK